MHSIRTLFLCCPTGPMWPQELLAERFNDFWGLNPLDYSVWGKSLRKRPTSSLTITKNSLKVTIMSVVNKMSKKVTWSRHAIFSEVISKLSFSEVKNSQNNECHLPKTGLTEIVKSHFHFLEWFNWLKIKNYIIKAR